MSSPGGGRELGDVAWLRYEGLRRYAAATAAGVCGDGQKNGWGEKRVGAAARARGRLPCPCPAATHESYYGPVDAAWTGWGAPLPGAPDAAEAIGKSAKIDALRTLFLEKKKK